MDLLIKYCHDVWQYCSIHVTAGKIQQNQKHNDKGFWKNPYLKTADGSVYVEVGGLNILRDILKVSGHWIIIHTIYNRHRNVLTPSRHISVKPNHTQLITSWTSSHHTNEQKYYKTVQWNPSRYELQLTCLSASLCDPVVQLQTPSAVCWPSEPELTGCSHQCNTVISKLQKIYTVKIEHLNKPCLYVYDTTLSTSIGVSFSLFLASTSAPRAKNSLEIDNIFREETIEIDKRDATQTWWHS